MAESGRSVITVLLACVLLHSVAQTTTSGTLYNVGGDGGWTLQTSSTFYDDQFSNITVFDFDALNFTFSADAHNVFVVDESALANCDSSNSQNFSSTSVTISLPAGTYGFICSFPEHCSEFGMHLNLTIQPSPSPLPAPSPAVSGGS